MDRKTTSAFLIVTRSDYSSLQMSLYFFLLIFFVILNYVHPNKLSKSKEVILGVRSSFGNSYIPQNIFIEQKQQLIDSILIYYKTKISNIAPIGFQIIESDDHMSLKIITDASSFFDQDSANINNWQKIFLYQLNEILSQEIKNCDILLEVKLGANNLTSDNSQLKLNISRLVSITDYLVESGLNSNLIEAEMIDKSYDRLEFSLKLIMY